MLELVRKYANQRLYGIKDCEEILCDVENYLFQQRVYQNPDCNIDTSCFDSTSLRFPGIIIGGGGDSSIDPVDIVCTTTITEVLLCNITITEK